jgi:hypothetical protein
MAVKRISMMLMVLLIAILTGCREAATPTPENDASIVIEAAVEPENPSVGESMLVISIRDAAGDPISDATLNIRGDMSHAGMLPVLAQADAGEEGVYRVPFEWTMSGDWFVEVTATLSTGETVSQRFDFSVRSQ